MKVLFSSGAFSGKLLLSIEDAQTLMELLGRARAVSSEYVNGKGYVYTYTLSTGGGEFVMIPNDSVRMPEDLKMLVQVKREFAGEAVNQLPESYVIPDEGVNVE